ncbi:uncharacterized protein BO97DRAFT_480930 [Aspergillus homomorphus CBS 101889]|uniref:AAA+ ATPase domain-containing protein n=1 Tax=Aspergillus homomorphus (strain CBS 101889) TaxID=1450537 RepID=A0A395HJQ5_ASPHC|nr:hypothetical protein BO97DRAFT_480930 [Aspergillus homomorphus CBS 101889]RAL08000.1 hypothetical protein BO97DRAFT_480930 [Aspergillus homomorphus CBS 101889]
MEATLVSEKPVPLNLFANDETVMRFKDDLREETVGVREVSDKQDDIVEPNRAVPAPQNDNSNWAQDPTYETAEAPGSTHTIAPDDHTRNTEKTDDIGAFPDQDDWQNRIKSLPRIPAVRMMNFDQFKNRHGLENGIHIIEVLRAGSGTKNEINNSQLEPTRGTKNHTAEDPDLNGTWIQRVRIQSEPIMRYVQYVAGASGLDVTRPWTFFRPFHFFIIFRSKLKEELENLERTWAYAERLDSSGLKQTATAETKARETAPVQDKKSDPDADDNKQPEMDPTGPEMSSITALRHMRCFVEFIDREIYPIFERYRGTSQQKVRFGDLWLLLKYNEMLYSPPEGEEYQNSSQPMSPKAKSMSQTVWKLCGEWIPTPKDGHPHDLGEDSQEYQATCYYIDHDGESYGAVKHVFKIQYFEGEKDITSLPVYPLRFAKDAEQIFSRLKAQGERFQSLINERHLRYEGWTVIYSPTGKLETDFKTPEHIESEVIIDLAEGYQRYPACKPEFVRYYLDTDFWSLGEDNIEIKHWSDAKRTMLLQATKEKLVLADPSFNRNYNNWLKGQPSFQIGLERELTQVTGEDLALFPRRLMAYVLRERKFVMVDIGSLQPVMAHTNAFRDLKIKPSHKRTVMSLVQAHFKREEWRKKHPRVELNQDLIPGKGSGLIILLHGAPGVGKTATAETVAQAAKRPLFAITCGDLGLTPSEVEEALSNITRLAHLWGCVLLLDEADIFLSRRGITDFKRNALVSVFLRVLEYYSGILFLTTNRVGSIDEAFKSRIHMSLYYEPLKRTQTLAIFQTNIDRLKRIELKRQEQARVENWKEPPLTINEEGILDYAGWYYDSFPEARWNGRQIRNAFQVAFSLAQYDTRRSSLDSWGESAEPEDEEASAGPTLDWIQFERVAEAIDQFDIYLQEATGVTDLDAARVDRVRADDFDYRRTAPRPRYQPARLTSERPVEIQFARPDAFRPNPRSNPPRRLAPGRGNPASHKHMASHGGLYELSRRRYQPGQGASAGLAPRWPQGRSGNSVPADWDDEASIYADDAQMLDDADYKEASYAREDDFDDEDRY